MKGNNQETTRAYFDGEPEGESYTGNLSFRYGKLYSYAMCIAVRLPTSPPTYLLRDRSESPSVTTSQHMGTAYSAAWKASGEVNSVHFELLDQAGIEFEDVCHVSDALGDNGYIVETENGFLTYMHVTYAMTTTIQTGKDVPCVFWTKDRPESVAHLSWSMLPQELWSAAYEGRVHRVGDLFFVLEPAFSGTGRDEQYVDVAYVGYERQRVGVLRRAVDHPEMCTGQVRIDGASFMPDKDIAKWYRIVPSALPPAHEQRHFARTPATQELIEWPIPPHSQEQKS